jgi:hypothetical protein
MKRILAMCATLLALAGPVSPTFAQVNPQAVSLSETLAMAYVFARIFDDPTLQQSLYGGEVAAPGVQVAPPAVHDWERIIAPLAVRSFATAGSVPGSDQVTVDLRVTDGLRLGTASYVMTVNTNTRAPHVDSMDAQIVWDQEIVMPDTAPQP